MSTTFAAGIPAQLTPPPLATFGTTDACAVSPFSSPCRPGAGIGRSRAAVAEMADFALRSSSTTTALRSLCALASWVGGSETVSITAVFDGSDLRTVVSTDRRAGAFDRLQYGLGAGPCVAALTDRQDHRCEDLATDRQWPRWAEQAMARGLASALSVPLSAGQPLPTTTEHVVPGADRAAGAGRVGDEVGSMGSLNVYSLRPRRFAANDVAALRELAVRIGLVVGRYRLQQATWRPVHARPVVRQVVAVPAEQRGGTPGEAPTARLQAQVRGGAGAHAEAENAVRHRRLPGLTTPQPVFTDCWRV